MASETGNIDATNSETHSNDGTNAMCSQWLEMRRQVGTELGELRIQSRSETTTPTQSTTSSNVMIPVYDSVIHSLDDFTFWISLSMSVKTE